NPSRVVQCIRVVLRLARTQADGREPPTLQGGRSTGSHFPARTVRPRRRQRRLQSLRSRPGRQTLPPAPALANSAAIERHGQLVDAVEVSTLLSCVAFFLIDTIDLRPDSSQTKFISVKIYLTNISVGAIVDSCTSHPFPIPRPSMKP